MCPAGMLLTPSVQSLQGFANPPIKSEIYIYRKSLFLSKGLLTYTTLTQVFAGFCSFRFITLYITSHRLNLGGLSWVHKLIFSLPICNSFTNRIIVFCHAVSLKTYDSSGLSWGMWHHSFWKLQVFSKVTTASNVLINMITKSRGWVGWDIIWSYVQCRHN